MAIWVPYQDTIRVMPTARFGEVHFYDGVGAAPTPPQAVEFWALPHPPTRECLEILNRMTGLKVVQLISSGVDHVLPYLSDSIVLCNAPSLRARSTAETALCLILASLNDIPTWIQQQAKHVWEWPPRRPGLDGKQILIVGYGAVGQAIHGMLTGFEVNVTAIALHPRPGVHGPADIERLLPEADIVVLSVPLTAATQSMMNSHTLRLMKTGSLLVNVSRGEIVNTSALAAQLLESRISAAIDVTDPEPLPHDHPLWDIPNVIISPHIGGHSRDIEKRASTFIAAQIQRYISGEPLEHVVKRTG